MNAETRYAIYLAPAPDSELWRFGSFVIGRDAASGVDLQGFAPLGYDASAWRALVGEPRRYGFHATLKAPFRLAASASPIKLEARVASLAQGLRPFDAGRLRVSTIPAGPGRAFVALMLQKPSIELSRLEAALVRDLDDLRAPTTAAERARRSPERLSQQQLAYLDSWGYPYVLDEFRLHFTLTNALVDAETIAASLTADFERSVESPELRVDALALFAEEGIGAPFRVVHRFPFGS